MNDIREKIRIARLIKGYSQNYMAVQLNISQRAYCKLECGKTKLSLKRFLVIVNLLEIDGGVLVNDFALA
jgi:transcriptional regulator with XRE-family HTH domain